MNILIYAYRMCDGGAERVASQWIKGFVNEGHKVSLLLEWSGFPITYGVPDGVYIYHNFLVHYNFRRFIPKFLRVLYVRRIIQKINPDLMILVEPGLWNVAHRATKGRIPIIATDHNAYERPDYMKMPRYLQKHKFKDSDKYDYLTVLTEADRNVLKEKKGEAFLNKVSVLPNPVTFAPLKEVPNKEMSILAAGRLAAWHVKGFDILLKAWSQIHSDFPAWILKIAGSGDQTFLKKMCADLNILDRVKFLGYVNMKTEYEKSSVFVLSSRYEGLGMVLMEAMSQGCACIACDYKGRQQGVFGDKENGVICPPDDVDALAKAMRKVLIDDDLRSNLQKNAVERSRDFELPKIMKEWDKIFKKMEIL